MQKDCLGDNIPSKDTYITDTHEISINHKFYYVKQLINNNTIKYVNIGVHRIYNIMLCEFNKMNVYNLILGTMTFSEKNGTFNKLYENALLNKQKNISFKILNNDDNLLLSFNRQSVKLFNNY